MEDAGFIIKDTLSWNYGSGFPKAQDLGKMIDKAAGAERKVVGHRNYTNQDIRANAYESDIAKERPRLPSPIEEPATDLARYWDGWKVGGIKPAWEPILWAIKPPEGSFKDNVLKWGVGAVNVDECRIPTRDSLGRICTAQNPTSYSLHDKREWIDNSTGKGRFPANVILDDAAGQLLDEQSGDRKSGGPNGYRRASPNLCMSGPNYERIKTDGRLPDSGGASRFFYCAKASRAEREMGLDNIEIVMVEYHTWENEDRKARLRVDMGQLPPRVIAVSGTPDNDVSEWNTFLFGNDSTGQSLPAIPFITVMEASSITESRTLKFLAPLLTKDYIVEQNGKLENGGNRVGSAEKSTPHLTIINAKTEFPRGAGNVASATQWTIKGNAGSPSDHPTVKPIALFEWLIKLVTRQGQTILDPFLGSGTTMIASHKCGRRCIGIEKEAEYVEIAKRRTGDTLCADGESGKEYESKSRQTFPLPVERHGNT